MANPNPMPLDLVVKNGSKRRDAASGVKPGPQSATEIVIIGLPSNFRGFAWRVIILFFSSVPLIA
jgi:hypothetical protein